MNTNKDFFGQIKEKNMIIIMNGMVVYRLLSPPKMQNIEMLLQWWFNSELSSLTHFDAISRSHADTSISYALALFSKVTLPFKLSEVLMNSEFAPSLGLNFG